MKKYIEVDSLKEMKELFNRGELFYKKKYPDGIVEYGETKDILILNNKYYKKNPNYCEFKKGQFVIVWNNEDSIFIKQFDYEYTNVFHTYDFKSWKNCRLPTDEEWEVFKNGIKND